MMKPQTKRMLHTSSVNWTKRVKKTAKALGKHAINLYSSGISRFIKTRDVKKLRQYIEDDLVIKDQMATLGCLLVSTFGDYLVGILVAVHTLNNLDRGDEPEMRVMKVNHKNLTLTRSKPHSA